MGCGEPAALLPGLRRLPLRRFQPDAKLVFFESWHGRYADNPRAISDELLTRDTDHQQVWAIADPDVELPARVIGVEPGSWEYLRWLGRAGTVVANNHMPGYFHPRQGVRYLQTWHGIPLKRIALDMPRAPIRTAPAYALLFARYMRTVRVDVRDWTWLLSPNRFTSDIFRRAFGYDGDILEIGYPRVDVLISDDRQAIRQRVRSSLGIGPDQRVLLYAPTFRDRTYRFDLEIDLAILERRMESDFVLLVRAHQTVASSFAVPDSPLVKDVSRVSDILELYLAADVLITDYSSVMFDFAVTGKPMVFFTYDLERYRDQLRGFYFDFEAEAPGPLVKTSEELADAVRDTADLQAGFAEPYARFVARFCYLEDGHASKRAVDALFAPGG